MIGRAGRWAPYESILCAALAATFPGVAEAVVAVEGFILPIEEHCTELGWPGPEIQMKFPMTNTSGAHATAGALRFVAEDGQSCDLGCQAGAALCDDGDGDIPDRLFTGPDDLEPGICVSAPDITGRYNSGTCSGQCNLSAPEAEGFTFFNYDAPFPSSDCFADDPAQSSCGSPADEWVAGTLMTIRLPAGVRLASTLAAGVYLRGENQFDAFDPANQGVCSDNGAICSPGDRTACAQPESALCVHMTHTPAVVFDWTSRHAVDAAAPLPTEFANVTIFVPDALDANRTGPSNRSAWVIGGDALLGGNGLRPHPGAVRRGYSADGVYDDTLQVDIRSADIVMKADAPVTQSRSLELFLDAPLSGNIQFADQSPMIGIVTENPACP